MKLKIATILNKAHSHTPIILIVENEYEKEELAKMKLFKRMREDMDVIFEKDPAARTYFEVFFTYSGLHAVWFHRIAHAFFRRKLFFIARSISQFSRFLTGIEIHPGAVIGRRFFIDHGMGVVIGETCEIGDDVMLYHGVTLGGTGHDKGKRHPTIGNNVLIATNAQILGAITIGDNSKVGGGSVVLKDVPANCTVVGIPAKIVSQDGQRIVHETKEKALIKTLSEQVESLQMKMNELQEEVKELKEGRDHDNHDL